ncbi:MAG: hypothetical protein SFX73_05695 [Kofleriaceae bacterium]|nr:hypothetical protein [Kofleriaceae bacterium]
MTSHRFRPRYRGVAWTAIGVGGSLTGIALALGIAALPLATGLVGVAFGAAYLGSPTWRYAVRVDDDGLEVRAKDVTKFKLAWGDIVRVIASPTTHTCFVDGGEPARSLLVPGDGAPAPYDLEDRPALVAAILARVPSDKVTLVETLGQFHAQAR